MLRRIINFVLIGLVLWIGSHFFPEIVQIDGMKTIILATVLIWIIATLLVVVSLLIIAVSAACGNVVGIIVGIISVVFAQVLTLIILSNCMDGFNIVGFWPKVIIAICFSIFSVDVKTNSKENSWE